MPKVKQPRELLKSNESNQSMKSKLLGGDEELGDYEEELDGRIGLEKKRTIGCAHVLTPATIPVSFKDIKKMSGLLGDNIFSYNAHGLHSWGWIPVFLFGTTWRVFTWELHAQGLAMIALSVFTCWQNSKFAHEVGLYDSCKQDPPKYDPSCFEGKNSVFASWILGAEGQLGTLVRFILGMFASLVIANTYSKNRGLLGTVFAKVLGFSMMVSTYIRPVNRDDPVEKQEVEHIQKYLVRLSNAGFRLMWIECRGEDGGMVDGTHTDGSDRSRGTGGSGRPHLMDGLLTKEEWQQIQHLESRITYIWQWCADCIADCTERGYIKDYHITVMMHNQLEELRGANVWGLPSLPYPYVFVVTFIVKVYLILAAMREGVTMGTIVSSAGEFGWDSTHYGLMALIIFYVSITNFLYQGLLDLHSLLKDPNKDEHCGHMPTASFVKFTKDGRCNCISSSMVIYVPLIVSPPLCDSNNELDPRTNTRPRAHQNESRIGSRISSASTSPTTCRNVNMQAEVEGTIYIA
jgi:hypothetical protein